MQPHRLGLELRRLRQDLGLRQRDLASHISVTPAFVSQLENGLCPPPSEAKLVLLAKLLQADPDVFIALAGRIPSDVTDLLQANPSLWNGVREAAQK
jgi:transcriptional regulator with XRE-family HTH domain